MELNQNNPTLNQPTQATAPSAKMFDADEISELAVIRESYEQITVAFGQLEMQRREVSKNERRINERVAATEAQEKVFLDKIMAKYGEGTFDITTGIFTPKN